MGYNTMFEGEFTLDHELSEEDFQFLYAFGRDWHAMQDTGGLIEGWCQWVPAADRVTIEWDGNDGFADYTTWLEYLVQNILAPRGYVVNGEVYWDGEGPEDVGLLKVVNNKVAYVPGTVTYEETPRAIRDHRTLRLLQAILSAPEWDSAADFMEIIAQTLTAGGYDHEYYVPEIGEPYWLVYDDGGQEWIEHKEADEADEDSDEPTE